jgi:hypothetical protein
VCLVTQRGLTANDAAAMFESGGSVPSLAEESGVSGVEVGVVVEAMATRSTLGERVSARRSPRVGQLSSRSGSMYSLSAGESTPAAFTRELLKAVGNTAVESWDVDVLRSLLMSDVGRDARVSGCEIV